MNNIEKRLARIREEEPEEGTKIPIGISEEAAMSELWPPHAVADVDIQHNFTSTPRDMSQSSGIHPVFSNEYRRNIRPQPEELTEAQRRELRRARAALSENHRSNGESTMDKFGQFLKDMMKE